MKGALLVVAVLVAVGATVARAADTPVSDASRAVAPVHMAASESDDPNEPTPTSAPPSQADEVFADGQGPPVYDRPSYTFDDESWARCETPASPGLQTYDGCNPFADGEADAWHYDKPYGRSPEDAVAFARWEPGRFERGGDAFAQGRGFYQSDRWRGPVSWDEGFYMDPSRRCGGYYGENLRVADQPVYEGGGGMQGCMP
jgi:hypothetical protein